MSFGESRALVIIGALLSFALAWPPGYVSIRPIGLIHINFQETGLIVMIGGAVSIAPWVSLLLTRHRAR